MKKIIAYMLILLFLFSLAACNFSGENEDNTPPPLNSGNNTENANKTQPPTNTKDDGKITTPDMNPLLPEYPIIDGSSSTEIMHEAIRAYLTDTYLRVSHSQTYAALERLVPGSDNPADVVLAVKYYDETLQDVKSRGADLTITPIAKEGFIFIVHKDNPINSLTQQQLRDIYSGRITNWKEIGGKDEEIAAYTRNYDSGSQTAMEDFMNGETFIRNDEAFLSDSMFGMLGEIEKSGGSGIGYNIYSWSMGQNLDSMNLKAIAVDSIAPDNKTLSDGSYPLMVYTYSYYNTGNAKGKALTDWLLTPEGQRVITSVGYVGILGDLPSDEMPDLYKDENDSREKVEEYYPKELIWSPESESYYYSFYGCTLVVSNHTDKQQIETLAGGKGKYLTVVYLAEFMKPFEREDGEWMIWTDDELMRFIVLTRERGGTFEVINEGGVLSYENGVIIPR